MRQLRCELYGSFGATGRGHGTDKAVILGLMGHAPDTVPIDSIPSWMACVREHRIPPLLGQTHLPFDPATDLRFLPLRSLPFHPNGLRFFALDGQGQSSVLAATFPSAAGLWSAKKWPKMAAVTLWSRPTPPSCPTLP